MATLPQKDPGYIVIDVNAGTPDKPDPRLPSMKQGFNRRWIGTNIDFVYVVYTPQGACTALDRAMEKCSPGTVRIVSGGHCYEDFVFDECVKAIINVTGLVESGYDDDRGYFVSSGDTNWGSFKTLFRDHGRVLPGGSCYSVGLGGHIVGGGDGILARLHGLPVDWLSGVEVVVKPVLTEDSVLKYVHKDSEGDDGELFWAHTGGGGGNFGIITKYYFKDLPMSPRGVIASNLHFSWDGFTRDALQDLLTKYFKLARCDWKNTVGKFQIFHQAAEEFVMYLYTSYSNDAEREVAQDRHYHLEADIEQIYKTCEPTKALGGHAGWAPFPVRPRKRHTSKTSYMHDETMDYPFYALTETINGSGPNQRGKYKSAYMIKDFPDFQIDVIWKYLTEVPDGLTSAEMKDALLQVDMFGGEIHKVVWDATAVAQREYIIKLQYQTYWQEEDKDAVNLKWIRDFYEEMYEPYGGVPDPNTQVESGKGVFEGCYFNYPDVDLNNWKNGKYGALELYFLGNLNRLIKAKKLWDPNEIFTNKQSIPTKPLKEPKQTK